MFENVDAPLSSQSSGGTYTINRQQKRSIAKELHSVPTKLLWDEIFKRNEIKYFCVQQCEELGIDYPCEILVRKED